MMPISKIDFFEPKIWQEGALSAEIDRHLAAAEDPYASGRWQSAAPPQVYEAYKQTLGGKPIDSFDPAGYLDELGLKNSLTAGRTNSDLLHAFHLIKEYHPDARYFPFSKKAAAVFQKFFLSTSRIAPGPLTALDRILDPLAVKLTEKSHNTYRYHAAPYGRFDDIARGKPSDLPKEACYLGVLRKQMRQFVWDRGPHMGSIHPGQHGEENFGTYDIAVRLGFSKQQAQRIAVHCYDVDISKTHYRDPHDFAKRRITGTVGQIGDIQRHYNRSPAGEEDTRITAARIHMARAHQLADERFYEAAEEEFAIGLHSLQDIFSHAQLSPSTHTCLGEFPDLVAFHPLSVYETALATEGYFKKFIAGLNLKPLEPAVEPQIPGTVSDAMVGGTAGPAEQTLVSQKTAAFPAGLMSFLKTKGIRIFVGAPDTMLCQLGFGADLDGDGRITPNHWVDVNQDGRRQWFEVEDQFEDGKAWDQQPAAYNHHNRLIFISARILNDPDFEAILKHEIHHAIDCCMQDHPHLGAKWQAYIDKLYNSARRQGTISFDEMDQHEFFAQS